MSFSPKTGEFIDLDVAASETAAYRASAEFNGTLAFAVGNEKLLEVMKQDGCVGIRAYKSLSQTDGEQLIFVGVDENGNDMVKGLILNRVHSCPTYCSTSNALNS